jgi:DNA-binding response OmpR family regulator
VIHSASTIKTRLLYFLVVAMMSKQWHILVVQDDENLNRNIINSLQRDGYSVQGVTSGAEAMRLLWDREFDVVISDQKMPDTDGFELLQWVRTYRPNIRMVMVAGAGSTTRAQALENGVVSYLEKPVDLHVLKEELRRLLQQTGFSASLDSFDLLDVIQIVTMSRKSIAMVVNTGLEEQGLLGFQGGELVWAEYGVLRGEEAFFALAAHKNGTVTHQPWNEQVTPNVTQPLSRLIFQALQYRSKYAAFHQATGEQARVTPVPLIQSLDDDSPFMFVAESSTTEEYSHEAPIQHATNEPMEWWQEPKAYAHFNQNNSGSVQAVTGGSEASSDTNGHQFASGSNGQGTNITPSTVHKTQASRRTDLPSWLIDQPTQFDMPALRPSSLTGSGQIPVRPIIKASPAEWQPAPTDNVAEQLSNKHNTPSLHSFAVDPSLQQSSKVNVPLQRQSSPEWQPPEGTSVSQSKPKSADLQSLQLLSQASPRTMDDLPASTPLKSSGPLPMNGSSASNSGLLPGDMIKGTQSETPSSWELAVPDNGSQRVSKRNYPALVAALQTLGYSIMGFVATAVVNLNGQPIAQVAVDDLDISPMCEYLSNTLQGMLHLLYRATWGHHEETIITSATHHLLIRLIGSDRDVFQVLITTRGSDPSESLRVMANVEEAIAAAL